MSYFEGSVILVIFFFFYLASAPPVNPGRATRGELYAGAYGERNAYEMRRPKV